MPVPDSYSRRYGREETTYTSSYTTRGTRSSYLSSYSGAKQSTSLPPRPPSLYGSDSYRKYGDSSSVTSRFLTSSGASSRLRDYGAGSSSTGGAGGYRSSVSPVRTSALRSSLADRLKAMELDGKDDDSPVRNSYSSRYTTLRSREPVSSIGTRTYTPTYSRDRSNSREYGASPLTITGSSSNLSSSQRERDASLTRSSTENLKKRGSPSPTSTNASSRKDSTGAVVANGVSSSEVNKQNSSSSSSTSESATCASKGVATHIAITTTSKKPLVTTSCATTTFSDTTTDNSVVIVDGNNTSVDVNVGDDHVNAVAATTVIVSDSSRAYKKCARDLENNDVDSSHSPSGINSLNLDDEITVTNTAISQDEVVSTTSPNNSNKSLGMVMMNNNSSDDDGGSKKDRNSVVMVVQDRNVKKLKSVPSSSTLKDTVIGASAPSSSSVVVDASGGGEQALGSSSSLSSASDSLFSASTTLTEVMENDSNGNPISMDSKDDAHSGVGVMVVGGSSSRYGKNDESGATSRSSSSTTVKVGSSARRRRESDSNANTLVDPLPNGKRDESGVNNGEDENKVSIEVNREPSPHETYTISKPRRSSAANTAAAVSVVQNNASSLPPRSSSSRVIYHTIKVEDPVTKSPSPEPISFTVKAPAAATSNGLPSANVGDNKQGDVGKKAASSTSGADTSAEFKVSLPRRRSSTVKPADLPSTMSSSSTPSSGNENRHSNGNVEPGESLEDSSQKSKLNSYTRQTNSPSKSGVINHTIRSQRKSASPSDKIVANQNHTSTLKNEEDSSSSVDDELSEHEKRLKRGTTPTSASSRSSSTYVNSATRKSKSKSPAPRVSKGSGSDTPSTSGSSKYLNNSEGIENVNGLEMGGPHTSKFAYVPSQLAENSSSLATNRNDRKSRYAHLTGASSAITSDSSDNVSLCQKNIFRQHPPHRLFFSSVSILSLSLCYCCLSALAATTSVPF